LCGDEISNTPNCSSLEESILVPITPRESLQLPDPHSESGGLTEEPRWREPPSLSTTETCPGRLANFRSEGGDGEISGDALRILGNSIRNNTRKSYKSAWSSYRSWCSERNEDPLRESIPNVLNYLSWLLNGRKLAYRSINLHRSAISYHVPTTASTSIGENPVVCSFMKGEFNINPPTPRH